jgi:coenzyme PQQ precursor peptide PqqA
MAENLTLRCGLGSTSRSSQLIDPGNGSTGSGADWREELSALMSHPLDPRKFGPVLLHRNILGREPAKLIRFYWRTFQAVLLYGVGAKVAPARARRVYMAWKAPKVVEVPVGMEINMYACAARK